MTRRFLTFLAIAAALSGAAGAALPASAQIAPGLEEVGQTIKLPSTDPRVIATNIINVSLGVIGIILVSLLVYAGFLYMTSGGEAEKTERAKAIIRNAIIGLIIVLSSWAIARYVLEKLMEATTGGGAVTGGGPPGGGFGGGGGGQMFVVRSITPQGSVPIRNVQVKIVFSKAVDEASVSAIVVQKAGASVAGTLAVAGSMASFTPSEACPPPNQDRKCFDGDSDFTVTVGSSVKSSQGQALTCGGFNACQAAFHTGNLIDTQPPSVRVTFPTDGMSIQENFLQEVQAYASDDSAVAIVEFFDGPDSIGIDAPNASTTPNPFTAKISWDTAGAALGVHPLTADASDIDTNTAKSGVVSVVVRPEICFKQPPEPGVTCGDPQGLCGACTGGSCTKNSDCKSGFCQNGICVEQPVISAVSPIDGQPGTFVTLVGVNFGLVPGTVTFLGDPANPGDDKVAQAPAACVSAGLPTWSPTQATVAVPDGAATGPMEIKNSSSGLSDRTDDDTGPPIDDFQANNAAHPGLCGLDPSEGFVNTESDAVGQGFGPAAARMLFGTTELTSFPSWSDSRVRFRVPVVNSGPYPVSVATASGESNAVTYTVKEKSLGAPPFISSIDPEQGPQQEYITLFGRNFGYYIGNVIFTDEASKLEAIGDTSFPSACSAGFWRDDTIVVKVPSVFKNNQGTTVGNYKAKIRRPDTAESNSVPFNIIQGTPKPGVCTIEPAIGPVNTLVKLFGDRFGTDKPSVTFSASKGAVVDAYKMTEVSTKVPDGAVTGPVVLKALGVASNPVNFQVRNCNESPDICGPPNLFQCCPTGECADKNATCGAATLSAEYAWQTSTGLIPVAPRVIEECRPDVSPSPTPSPSPWDGRSGGNQTPVDAVITMRFSRPLDPQTVKASAFRVYACTAKTGDPCATKTDVMYSGPVLTSEVQGQQDVVKLTPTPKFATGTTYLVTVAASIKASGPGGATMDERKECGLGPNKEPLGYCFRFTTRASSDPSTVGAVNVIPLAYTMNMSGDQTLYQSVPLDAGDRCIVLNCRQYDWNWYTGTVNNPDGRAAIDTADKDGDGKIDCEQLGTGLQETGDVPVDMNANLTDTSLFGTGKLYVKFIPPKVEDYAPNCDKACSNALVWARFSSKMDENSVTRPGNVDLRKCYNENCVEAELLPPPAQPPIAVTVDLTEPPATQGDVERYLAISPASPLEPGAFYRVLLKSGANQPNGIKGQNGMPVTGLNHPQGFAWTFRVKLGVDAYCTADRVDVVPPSKLEPDVSGRQLFTATPFGKPDECSASGQALVQGTSAAWSFLTPNIADYHKIKGQLVDRGGTLPSGCTGKCLASGAGGLYGKVAVCGNGTIETTDGNYCKAGKRPNGKDCTLMAAGAKGGEECEPSVDGVDLCDANTCLWRSVQLFGVGGTCGNGVPDYSKGEACDYGPTCVGGSTATTTTPVPENTPCGTVETKAACVNAGGDCNMREYRGCTASCRHLGAPAGKTTCGNSDPFGDGKDCDDGNTRDGDGCSSICLHEGGQPASTLAAVCGNAILEPGETCERPALGAPFPSGCDASTCLHTGTLACVSDLRSCCGNGSLDNGEDCDDGNHTGKDGCGASCLFEGSDPYYADPNGGRSPSFCSNGILEQGEQCEAQLPSNTVAERIGYGLPPKTGTAVTAAYGALNPPNQKGDNKTDRSQLAYIMSSVVPDTQTGVASTTLNVNLMEKDGQAAYGLQCGYTEETSCEAGFGLDDNGCCRPRPKVTGKYPEPLATGVCRNVQLSGTFNEDMNIGSVVNNFEVSQPSTNDVCPEGTKEVLVQADDGPGILGWIKRIWHQVVAWWRGMPAYAEKWCVGKVTGQLKPVSTGKTSRGFAFTLDKALDANTAYRVRFIGDDSLADNADKKLKKGVKTDPGVVHPLENGDGNGDLVWNFETGAELCAVNVVTVTDVTTTDELGLEHPYLFINAGNQIETRAFQAQAQSIQNGQAVPLSPVADYSWSWNVWTSSDPTVVDFDTPALAASEDATSRQKNGHAILTATLKVSTDDVNVPSTKDTTVQGIADVNVLVCENPWPMLDASPFRDRYQSVNLSSGPFSGLTQSSYFNFSTMYCRDAGQANVPSDDLPQMNITQVPLTAFDVQNGIMRQYLFVYGSDRPDLKQDGIGIRIMSNLQHLSPETWYASRGFTGKPTSITVDGYPAIQDGTTMYVAASNRPNGVAGKIFSNIYLISHNPNAASTTLNIYDQMVRNLVFNINQNFTDQSNSCRTSNNDVFVPYLAAPKPVTCTADWECLAYGPDLHCDSTKAKITRDTIRISDFQSVANHLESGKDAQGRYPTAAAGTFLRGISTSLWPSWKTEIGDKVGADLPVDPVNRFLTCGKCEVNSEPCRVDKDCPQAGNKPQACKGGEVKDGNWAFDDKIDPLTCWNSQARQFLCPKIGTLESGASRFYRYTALNNALQYKLASEYEVPPGTAEEIAASWWYPPLPDGMYKCVATSTYGQYCVGTSGAGDDALCSPKYCSNAPSSGCAADGDCTGGTCISPPVIPGACRKFGGSFQYKDLCQAGVYGEGGTCGDGALNTGETCEIGQTQLVPCTLLGNVKGHRLQSCDACTSFKDDPQHPSCIPDAVCGNGRIDKKCGSLNGSPCLTSGDCSGGQLCVPAEDCDDGALNNTYGHCNNQCTGYAGYCGDEKLSPGEVCDMGSPPNGENGEWNNTYDPTSCALDCKGVGPYCGNNEVDGSEECDGTTEATQSKVCSAPNEVMGKVLCDVDDDCDYGTAQGTCGGGATHSGDFRNANGGSISPKKYDSCKGVYRVIDGIVRETQHTRTCEAPGESDACKWPGWSKCQAVGSCGDGIQDTGEECDDGTDNGDTKACTTSCNLNVCGDNKVNVGVEECDQGEANGTATCSADYDSSCLSCSKLCKFLASAGGYCGNAIKDGPEQCDGSVPQSPLIDCPKLGYDYGTVNCSTSCVFGGCTKCSDTPGEGVIEARVYDAVFQQVVPNARATLLHKGVKVDEAFTDNDGVFKFTSLNTNSACSSYRIVIDMYQDNPCTGADRGDTVSCYADLTPPWTYPNPVDEGVRGGYFPFTSDPFRQTAFADVTNGEDIDGKRHIDIFPLPERGQAYVAVTWKSRSDSRPTRYVNFVLPKAAGYTIVKFQEGEHATKCDYDKRPAGTTNSSQCSRSLNWGSIGDWDLGRLPYSRLICMHRAGEKTAGWSDTKKNGCPIEGTTACKEQYLKQYPDIDFSECDTATGLAALACAACGVDSAHGNACKAEGDYESCGSLPQYGPIVGLVNYAPFKIQTDPVDFYYKADPGESASFKSFLDSTWGVKAYAAITPISGNSEIYTLQKPSGTGWAWKIASVDVQNNILVRPNTLVGSDNAQKTAAEKTQSGELKKDYAGEDPKAIAGMGVWAFHFQSGFNNYCIADDDDTKIQPDVITCGGGRTATCGQNTGYKCGPLNAWTYSLLNW